MTATSYERGWPIYYNGQWRYRDTKKAITGKRPCCRCNQAPLPEGYDACIGHQKGVVSACCGHGITEPIYWRDDESN